MNNLYKIKEQFILNTVDDFQAILDYLRSMPINYVAEKNIKGAGVMGPTDRNPWNKGYWLHESFFEHHPQYLTDNLQRVFDIPFVMPSLKFHIFNHLDFTMQGGYYPHIDAGYHNGKVQLVPATLNFLLFGGGDAVTSWYACEESRDITHEASNDTYAAVGNDPYRGFTKLDSHIMNTGEACIFNSNRYHDVIVGHDNPPRITLGMHFDPAIGSFEDVVHQFKKRDWI